MSKKKTPKTPLKAKEVHTPVHIFYVRNFSKVAKKVTEKIDELFKKNAYYIVASNSGKVIYAASDIFLIRISENAYFSTQMGFRTTIIVLTGLDTAFVTTSRGILQNNLLPRVQYYTVAMADHIVSTDDFYNFYNSILKLGYTEWQIKIKKWLLKILEPYIKKELKKVIKKTPRKQKKILEIPKKQSNQLPDLKEPTPIKFKTPEKKKETFEFTRLPEVNIEEPQEIDPLSQKGWEEFLNSLDVKPINQNEMLLRAQKWIILNTNKPEGNERDIGDEIATELRDIWWNIVNVNEKLGTPEKHLQNKKELSFKMIYLKK
jgi:hypothetical protein